jgi:amino acid adenylation domain-containing protein
MSPRNVISIFADIAARFAAKPAVEWRNQRVTYRELDDRSNRIAHWLISGGAAVEDPVVIALANSFDTIPAVLGVWKAGCAIVPVDLNNPGKRTEAMIRAINPRWMITDTSAAPTITSASEVPKGKVFQVDRQEGLRDLPDPDRIAARIAQVTPDSLAYLYFTSGSTGTPKAIAGRPKSVAHFIEWESRTLKAAADLRVSQFTHPAFDAFLRDMFLPLCNGGTICIPDSRDVLHDANRLSQWIDEQRIQVIHCVPSLFRTILSRELRPELFRDLKYVLMAGEAVSPADVKRWINFFGERIQLVNLYGPTETTMVKFFHFITRADAESKSIPIGKPIDGTRALIVNPEGKACPPNFVGEIYIRTPYMTLGYYQAPELTRQVFIPNPFSKDPNDIVYRTGDLGRMLPDGTFEFLGRSDFQVKIRGVRVELGEIESALRACEGVRDSAVIVARDPNDEPYLAAYVAADTQVQVDTLRQQIAAELPANFVPSVFIRLDQLPLLANGKVDRKALPLPEKQRSNQTAFRAPETPTEKQLVAIWSDLLAIERIGADDDFFSLGGHSLLATQLMSRIRATFEIEVPLGVLFEGPTVAKLAKAVDQKQLEAADEDLLAELLNEVSGDPELKPEAVSNQ